MVNLFLFLLISLGIGAAILFINKGEKATEIKSLLQELWSNTKVLANTLKKLFILIKGLIVEEELESSTTNEQSIPDPLPKEAEEPISPCTSNQDSPPSETKDPVSPSTSNQDSSPSETKDPVSTSTSSQDPLPSEPKEPISPSTSVTKESNKDNDI